MSRRDEFIDQFIEIEMRSRRETGSNVEWTTHLSTTIFEVATRMGWDVVTKASPMAVPVGRGQRSELLTIDAVCWERKELTHTCPITNSSWAYPQPMALVEFENNPGKALYDYWKLLCVRSVLRVFTLIADDRHDELLKALGELREAHADVPGDDVVLLGPVDMANSHAPWSVFHWSPEAGRFVG